MEAIYKYINFALRGKIRPNHFQTTIHRKVQKIKKKQPASTWQQFQSTLATPWHVCDLGWGYVLEEQSDAHSNDTDTIRLSPARMRFTEARSLTFMSQTHTTHLSQQCTSVWSDYRKHYDNKLQWTLPESELQADTTVAWHTVSKALDHLAARSHNFSCRLDYLSPHGGLALAATVGTSRRRSALIAFGTSRESRH